MCYREAANATTFNSIVDRRYKFGGVSVLLFLVLSIL